MNKQSKRFYIKFNNEIDLIPIWSSEGTRYLRQVWFKWLFICVVYENPKV